MTLLIDSDLVTIDSIPPVQPGGVQSDMLRLDLIHPQISGNKWFKLKKYIEKAKQMNKTGLITLGGAWSNHLLAVAAAAHELNWTSVGIIRGEMPENESATLSDCRALGMKTVYVDRSAYKQRKDLLVLATAEFPELLVVDEGGQGEEGIAGATEILRLVPNLSQYSHILCAVGTGTMLCGLAISCLPEQQVIGISSLKGADTISDNILYNHPELTAKFTLLTSYHFGGYAKFNAELIDFMNSFYKRTGIPTDLVYTAKLCYAWEDLCRQNYFQHGAKILLIHSGGLQGNRSLPANKLLF